MNNDGCGFGVCRGGLRGAVELRGLAAFKVGEDDGCIRASGSVKALE